MVIVLGGGIGGLSAAFYLLKNTKQIPRVFEASPRIGGWIKTNFSANDQKVRFENGPRTIRPVGLRGLNTLALCSELNLDDEVLSIPFSHPAAKNRMLAIENKLCPLPSSIMSMFRKLEPFEKPLVHALWNDYRNNYQGDRLQDDSIYNFTARRFGDDIAKYLVSAMVCGICAGDAKQISVKFLMEKFFRYEQEFGSVCNGIISNMFTKNENQAIEPKSKLIEKYKTEKWSIYSMRNGLETLPLRLAEYLRNKSVKIDVNSPCEHLEVNKASNLVVVNGKEHKSNCVVSSLPAFELGRLLIKQHPELAEELVAIPYVDVAVVNLQFKGNLIRTPGFGFLVPPCENRSILGVIYDSSCFDMGDNTVFTVMMGGKWFNEKFGKNITENKILEIAVKEVTATLKINPDELIEAKVNILRRCIPQYVIGHHDRIQKIQKYIRDNELPLYLCGSAFDGVGVNDVIYSAKNAVKQTHL